VRCQVPNADGRLKPEMYASLALGAGEAHEVLVVPSAAVQELRGKPIVFVRTAQGSFERRDVTLGAEAEGWIEVRSGVTQGESVVTTGAFLLKSELLRGRACRGGVTWARSSGSWPPRCGSGRSCCCASPPPP